MAIFTKSHSYFIFCRCGSGSEYEALLRRGDTLIVQVTTSSPLSSSYTLTLTFISAYHSNDRFGQFRAKGSIPNSTELWFSITLPANFPVGKFHYHVHLSTNRGRDVASYHHNKPVAVLFNPWLPGIVHIFLLPTSIARNLSLWQL